MKIQRIDRNMWEKMADTKEMGVVEKLEITKEKKFSSKKMKYKSLYALIGNLLVAISDVFVVNQRGLLNTTKL